MRPDKLATQIENLPDYPGVYQFIDSAGKVIYVGKAKNLKNRVRSYFNNKYIPPRTQAMVNKANNLEVIVTDNEIEALVLENNLIKKFKPRYNVNLKDDKSYPFIKITNEPFPRIYPTRRVVNDGGEYLGPYTDVKNMKSALRLINQTFKIRSCKLNLTSNNIKLGKFKVCLDYHIRKCEGPCEGLQSPESYNEIVKQVTKLIKGKTEELIREMKDQMRVAAENFEFELAAEIRDRILKIQTFSDKQKIVSTDAEDRDIIGIAYEGKDASCSVLNIRNGKLIGKKEIKINLNGNDEKTEIYSSFIKQYYSNFLDFPSEIILEVELEDSDVIQNWFESVSGKKIFFTQPKRGDLKSLLKMCLENAKLQLKELQLQKMKKDGNIPYTLSALKRDLRLKNLPKQIECFDISNLQGTDTVASRVVFIDGKPKKNLYKKYIIKTVEGADDFKSMREVIFRAFVKVKENGENLPDLIMVDGGKGQLSSAVAVLEDLQFKDYAIIGLAKRLEEIFVPGQEDPIIIPKVSSSLKLLQQLRDEAHRFAITFHRTRRSKRTIKTELTGIPGIGEIIATKLLTKIGSVQKIKESTIEELTEIIGTKKASLVYNYYNNGVIK